MCFLGSSAYIFYSGFLILCLNFAENVFKICHYRRSLTQILSVDEEGLDESDYGNKSDFVQKKKKKFNAALLMRLIQM